MSDDGTVSLDIADGGTYPEELIEQAARYDLIAPNIPEEYGGPAPASAARSVRADSA